MLRDACLPGQVRVELLVPLREERVADVESLSVQRELQHLRAALDTLPFDVQRLSVVLHRGGDACQVGR